MNKINNPYAVLLERLHDLDQSIHVLNLVNNDLRQILHKQYIECVHFFLNCYLNISNLENLYHNLFMIHSNDPLLVNPKLLLHFLLLHQLVRENNSIIMNLFHIYLYLESEEMRLAASIIDKAKRTIEVSSGREAYISHSILFVFYFSLQ